MRRIEVVSRVLRNILLAGLMVEGVGIMALVIAAATVSLTRLKSQAVFENYGALAALPLVFMVTLSFFRFFDRLNSGHLFDSQTVRHLKSAGKWWLGLGLIQVILASLEGYLFSARNIMISGDGIVAGLAIGFIAWIMDEGRKLQEEHELTI